MPEFPHGAEDQVGPTDAVGDVVVYVELHSQLHVFRRAVGVNGDSFRLVIVDEQLLGSKEWGELL